MLLVMLLVVNVKKRISVGKREISHESNLLRIHCVIFYKETIQCSLDFGKHPVWGTFIWNNKVQIYI